MKASVILAGLMACAAGGALAQDAPTAASETVIVTAPRLSDHIDAVVHDFVVNYAAPATLSGELTRWTQPICPRTDGLSKDEYTAYVSQRIRAVAAMAGVKVAATPCKPNIEVLFTDRPQETLDRVHAHNVDLLGYKGVTVDTHPIQAWYLTGTTDLNGTLDIEHEVFADIHTPGPIFHGMGGQITWTIPTAHVNGYRMKTDIQSQFVNVLIIADRTKTGDYALGPIADYIAVMALAETKAFQSCQAMPSITNLMAADCPPERRTQGLTDGDLAFLRGVYRMSPDEPLGIQQSQVAFEIKDELTGQAPAGPPP